MSFELTVQKPTAVIFLDIDGVLIGDRSSPWLGDKISSKLKELFREKEGFNGGFTELEWRIAASHFFSKDAVANLDNLIKRVKKIANIVIVISSAWRNDGTVPELKEHMFAIWPFSQFIIDKTPDDGYRSNLYPVAKEKYGFSLRTRGEQIDYWLRENHEKLNIKSFIIFDDYDDGISERYPSQFIEVRYPLSESDAEKAYHIMAQFSFSSQHFPTKISKTIPAETHCNSSIINNNLSGLSLQKVIQKIPDHQSVSKPVEINKVITIQEKKKGEAETVALRALLNRVIKKKEKEGLNRGLTESEVRFYAGHSFSRSVEGQHLKSVSEKVNKIAISHFLMLTLIFLASKMPR